MKSSYEWCKCPKCGHKMFKLLSNEASGDGVKIEIKCSSCKAIVNVILSEQGVTCDENKT